MFNIGSASIICTNLEILLCLILLHLLISGPHGRLCLCKYANKFVDMFVCLFTAQCKWSNEDCEFDEDCCSQSCVKLHEGTNPRCAKSPMHYPCFFVYQCEEGLACGSMYSCCAPYWGVCVEKDDCCDKSQVCREMDGFTYNRCLPSSTNIVTVSKIITVLTMILTGVANLAL